jgi:hypothetical protein
MAFRNRPVFKMVAGLHFYPGKMHYPAKMHCPGKMKSSSKMLKVSVGILIKAWVPKEQKVSYIFEERKRK